MAEQKVFTEYLNTDTLESLEQALQDEILRTKLFVNENGFHNGTALNAIVRRYRRELKEYCEIVRDDYLDIKGEGFVS